MEWKGDFDKSEFDYRKIGTWSIYDTPGSLAIKEFYVDGVLNQEKPL